MQAIEYMDLASMDMVRDMNKGTMVYPFDQDYKHYVLIETAQTVEQYESGDSSASDYNESSDTERLYNFLE